MNHGKYLERLKKLADQLQEAGNARPYDPDEYNRIVDELNTLLHPQPAKPKSKWILRIILIVIALVIFVWLCWLSANEHLDPLEIVEIWRY